MWFCITIAKLRLFTDIHNPYLWGNLGCTQWGAVRKTPNRDTIGSIYKIRYSTSSILNGRYLPFRMEEKHPRAMQASLCEFKNSWQNHVREKALSRAHDKDFLREKQDENKKTAGWNPQNSEMMRSERLFHRVRKAVWWDKTTEMMKNSLENFSSERHFDKSPKTAKKLYRC